LSPRSSLCSYTPNVVRSLILLARPLGLHRADALLALLRRSSDRLTQAALVSLHERLRLLAPTLVDGGDGAVGPVGKSPKTPPPSPLPDFYQTWQPRPLATRTPPGKPRPVATLPADQAPTSHVTLPANEPPQPLVALPSDEPTTHTQPPASLPADAPTQPIPTVRTTDEESDAQEGAAAKPPQGEREAEATPSSHVPWCRSLLQRSRIPPVFLN